MNVFIAHLPESDQDFLLLRLESLKGYLIEVQVLSCNEFPTLVLFMTKSPMQFFKGNYLDLSPHWSLQTESHIEYP